MKKLIEAYALAMVESSWSGSRPLEEWAQIEQDLEDAARALELEISNITGQMIKLSRG
jgi:hypothetical protein